MKLRTTRLSEYADDEYQLYAVGILASHDGAVFCIQALPRERMQGFAATSLRLSKAEAIELHRKLGETLFGPIQKVLL